MKRRRKLSAWQVAICFRVRNKLIALQRVTTPEPELTVEEYRQMDRTVMMMEICRMQR